MEILKSPLVYLYGWNKNAFQWNAVRSLSNSLCFTVNRFDHVWGGGGGGGVLYSETRILVEFNSLSHEWPAVLPQNCLFDTKFLEHHAFIYKGVICERPTRRKAFHLNAHCPLADSEKV